MSASGLWQFPGSAGERTTLEVKAAAQDVGKYLARFGYPDIVANGTAGLEGALAWAGPLARIDYPSLAGNLTLKAETGQFLKMEPGMGKLLGVLSLQSLPRRLTLDFRDVFSEGFAFDSIAGSAKIVKGVASTEGLAMAGPMASVAIAGTADLARETQDLTVRVVPVVGDSVAIAASLALLNPIIGAGAFLAQRLLKDPLGQMLAFEYHVTGTWEDPKVIKTRDPQSPAGKAPAEKPPARRSALTVSNLAMNRLPEPFRVAAIQMVSGPSVAENLATAAELIAKAARQRARLVVLPEWFCLMGNAEGDKVAARERDGEGPIQSFLARTAR